MSIRVNQLKFISKLEISPFYQAILDADNQGATVGEPSGPSSELLFENLIKVSKKLVELGLIPD